MGCEGTKMVLFLATFDIFMGSRKLAWEQWGFQNIFFFSKATVKSAKVLICFKFADVCWSQFLTMKSSLTTLRKYKILLRVIY